MSELGDDVAERYRAPALDKGLDILELLADCDEGLSQAEIAKALERTPNEIYRMLDRLVRRHYVIRDAGDRYQLSLKLFSLAYRHPPTRRLVSQALPPMRRFAREAEQSCHLVVYDRGSLVVVAQVDSPGYWGVTIKVGSHIGLVNTGSGHVLLAFASPAERSLMLEEREVMPHELWPNDFERRLDEVRERGHEVMQSQQTLGVTNISLPLLGPGGTVLAALTCPYLERIDTARPPSRDAVLELLARTASEITAGVGDRG
ncbi:IclR family transcriptional regulator [Mangrovicella endophytica]|uniref:IclR family transcriptional regulator n=1 Tax=Mangrovicella endophytica TaxID=2066697 RepID=UPI000C9E0AF9|nr:IclR family transcriptional regulator [Mangrovicella endophytica]